MYKRVTILTYTGGRGPGAEVYDPFVPVVRRRPMNITTKLLISLILLLGLAGMPWADVRGRELLQALHTLARPLRDANDLAPLLDAVDDARLVLLGEASHGTREFYAWRDLLSRRLIREHGFSFIAIEGDIDCGPAAEFNQIRLRDGPQAA